MANHTYIGIDIGGTNTALGLVDDNGNQLVQSTFPTRSKEPVSVFMMNLEKEILPMFRHSGKRPVGIGIGVPGANKTTGLVEAPENFEWGYIKLAELLQKKYHLPVRIINDADAAALGEMYFGVAQEIKNFVYITLGTGLGNSNVVEGKIVSGKSGLSGELGHTKICPDKRLCACGKRGCLETVVSANGIRRTVLELLSSENTKTRLNGYNFDNLTPKIITEMAASGDSIALKTYRYTGRVLGKKIADLIGLLNPEALVFSGGITGAGEFLFKPMREVIEQNLLNIHQNTFKILVSDMETNYAVPGAASLLMKRYNS